MTYTHLLHTVEANVVRLTLNRPEVHNAFNEKLIAELTDAYTQAGQDSGVRAIVLSAAGPTFCAGADLAWMGKMAHYSHDENMADARLLAQMFQAIAHCPKITITAVQGAAIGGGAGLVAVSDIAIAAEEATFALSEVRLGLVPAVIGPYVLEKTGMGAARALFVTGERFDAAKAQHIGLVQEVVTRDALSSAVEAKLGLARKAGPMAVATAKSLLRTLAGLTPDEAADLTVECIASLRVSPEGQEGIHAFLEKRKPDFAD